MMECIIIWFLIQLSPAVIAPLLCLTTIGLCEEELRYRNVSAREALQLNNTSDSLVVLDVRTKEDFEGYLGRLQHALLISLQELEQRVHDLDKYKTIEILVYCRSDRRSARACEVLSGEGFKALNGGAF